jgi:hypothetical protein
MAREATTEASRRATGKEARRGAIAAREARGGGGGGRHRACVRLRDRRRDEVEWRARRAAVVDKVLEKSRQLEISLLPDDVHFAPDT